MDTIEKIQKFRTQLIQEINIYFDDIIQSLRMEETIGKSANENIEYEYECVYPLTSSTSIFKGKKPIGVRFSNNVQINVPTWKKVVEVILKECNSVQAYHRELEKLCGKVSGRERVFLANKPDNMRSPIEIDKNIYIETHYDTETLLKIITTRILTPIHYNYSGIEIVIRND